MATHSEATLTVGQALPSLMKDVSQRRIDVYSGVRPRSIHSDEAFAREKGFRTCLAQGMMSTAYVSQMMVKLLGPGFARGGTMSMAFIKPVYAGDRLTVRGDSRSPPPVNWALATTTFHARPSQVRVSCSIVNLAALVFR